jgi:hypothetical protein
MGFYHYTNNKEYLTARSAALRHRIVAAAAPWMATADSFDGKPEAFERPVFFKCLQRILAAGRSIAAFGPKPRTYDQLVKSDD